MAKKSSKKSKKRHPRWFSAQPHDAKTGRLRTKKYSKKRPEKVVWVKNKK